MRAIFGRANVPERSRRVAEDIRRFFMTNQDLISEAKNALKRGDAKTARAAFEQLTQQSQSDIAAWMGLADAARLDGDQNHELHAIERALALQPSNISALIAKADILDSRDDVKTAGSYYNTALAHASKLGSIAPELRTMLMRAQQKCADYAQRYEQYLRDRLQLAGARADAAANGSFGRSLDLMFGKRQAYAQQPQQYFFPGLPSIEFYNPTDFSWIETLNARTDEIARELNALIAADASFEPYVQRTTDTPRADHRALLDNPDWSALFLWKDGDIVEKNAQRCPATMAALADVPMARIPGNSPTALFSLLRPGARIPPHHGLINTRLICHLPLIAPGQCGLRVGAETREWRRGETLVFDDTIEHEAWNNSAEPRVVLLFDIEQPLMHAEEHAAVAELFTALNDFS